MDQKQWLGLDEWLGWGMGDIPSGYVKIVIENGPFVVDLPIKDGDFPVRYVNLPEGNYRHTYWANTGHYKPS